MIILFIYSYFVFSILHVKDSKKASSREKDRDFERGDRKRDRQREEDRDRRREKEKEEQRREREAEKDREERERRREESRERSRKEEKEKKRKEKEEEIERRYREEERENRTEKEKDFGPVSSSSDSRLGPSAMQSSLFIGVRFFFMLHKCCLWKFHICFYQMYVVYLGYQHGALFYDLKRIFFFQISFILKGMHTNITNQLFFHWFFFSSIYLPCKT